MEIVDDDAHALLAHLTQDQVLNAPVLDDAQGFEISRSAAEGDSQILAIQSFPEQQLLQIIQ
jgi:hypothetical protein